MVTARICTKCRKVKPLTNKYFYFRKDYQKYRTACIDCCLSGMKEYQKTPQSKRWRKEYRQRDYVKAIKRKQSKTLKAKARRNKYERKRRAEDPLYNLKHITGRGMRQSLKRNGGQTKKDHWERLVNYTAKDLKKHLEKQFKEGMTWQNHGDWHIDHIVPISKFNFTSPHHIDFKRCWALENLQPLWAQDNIIKGNTLKTSIQPSLLL